MPEKSRLMPISYYNPKQEIRLSAYADTIVLEPNGCESRLRAIRFGGYPEMVRAMSDAIYAGATLETEFAGETAMLSCEPKKYECHLSHDGIYAEATILSLDDEDTAAKKDEEAQADGQTNVELPPRKCVLFCPAGDRRALFEALDRKTAVPLIPEFQDYVLDELQRRRLLKPLRVISIRERLEAWLLLCKKDDANIVKVLEDGLKTGTACLDGAVKAAGLAVQNDFALIRLVDTGQNLNQGGLACAVLADQTVDGAALNVDGDVIQRLDAGELFCDIL